MSKTEKAKITRRDIWILWFRSWWCQQWDFTMERMQAPGYCFSIRHILRKLYPDKEDLKEAIKRNLVFFNTQPGMAHLIQGAHVALEEKEGKKAWDAAQALKAGLMGPFAGIGDTVFFTIWFTILAAIGASLILEGNWWGWLLPVVFNVIPRLALLRPLFTFGSYRRGGEFLVSALKGGVLEDYITIATIVGFMVIGGMAPAFIGVRTPITYSVGGVEVFNLQKLLDIILPGLIPMTIFLGTYFLIRKKVSAITVIVLLTVIGLVGSILGILA